MTTATATLTEFLLARIAEDEAVARAAVIETGQWWKVETQDPFHDTEPMLTLIDGADADDGSSVVSRQHEPFEMEDGEIIPPSAPAYAQFNHIARHDPARILAECAAKRRIVELLEDERQRKDIYNRDYPLGLLTTEGDLKSRATSNARWAGLEIAARALASVYADHPDYRDEWAS